MPEIETTFGLFAVLALLAAFGRWTDRLPIGQFVPGAIFVLLGAMALSNMGVIPSHAPFYGVVSGTLVPMAVALLLLKADLPNVIRGTGSMLTPFLLGAAGTMLGALLAFYITDLGARGAALSGLFSATYIGGSLNFVAVGKALELIDTPLYAAALVVDIVAGTVFLVALCLIPLWVWLGRWFPAERIGPRPAIADADADTDTDVETPAPAVPAPFDSSVDIGLSLGLAAAICFMGDMISELLGLGQYSILVITVLALGLAASFPVFLSRLRLESELGTLFLYVFFAAIGAEALLGQVFLQQSEILLFAAILLAVHLLVILFGSMLFRVDLPQTLIASNACVLGPATAVAVAAAQGRRHLITPSLMCGILGYAIGSFLGVTLAQLLK